MSLPEPAPDLYEILGVKRDATPEEIKKAYRSASKRAHPDMQGGSAAEFAKVQHAWNILGDPERRQRYDATGDSAEATPDNSAARIISFIMGALDRAMQANDVDHRDLVGAAVKLLQSDQRAGNDANEQLKGTKKKLQNVRKRLKFKGDGPDLIDRTLADRLGELDRNIAGNEAVMAQVGEAIEKLQNGWDYAVDVRVDPWGDRPAAYRPMKEALISDILRDAERRGPGSSFFVDGV